MSILVGIGLSKNKNSYLAGREAAYKALQKIHTQPEYINQASGAKSSRNKKNISIAFVFASIHFEPKELLEGIAEILDDAPVVGSSGAGIITSEGIDMHAVTVMAISSAKIKFAAVKEDNLDQKDARAAGQILARNALKKLAIAKREIFIMFIDGLMKDGTKLVAGIKEALGISFPLVGGASADDLHFNQTYQFFNRQALTNSIVGVLVGENAIIKLGTKHGWKPLGKPRIVTSSFGNIIKTIDDKPAIGMYEDYFGKDNQEIKSNKLISLSVRYPLGIYIEGEEEYLLRNALRAESDGSLVCQGDVPQGSTLKLMMGTKQSALKATLAAAESLKKLSDKENPIKFALIFDSFSRNRLLGRKASAEIEIIKKTLGKDIPFIGFYSYGEHAPLTALDYRGQSHLHNESIAILGIGEQ